MARAAARLSFHEAVCDDGAALRGALREHGYAHVTNVVPLAECAAWAEALRFFIASLGFRGAAFDDPASVADPSRWPDDCQKGIFGGFGAGKRVRPWDSSWGKGAVAARAPARREPVRALPAPLSPRREPRARRRGARNAPATATAAMATR